MSDRAAVVEQVVAVATVETERGPVAAVAVEQAPAATAVAEQGLAGPPGERGEAGPPGGSSLTIEQAHPAAVWTLAHRLNRYPAVILVDTAGDQFDADVRYVDADTVIVTIIAPVAGVAYLN